MLKIHEIRELIKLVDQSAITDFEYEFEGLKVAIKKAEKGEGTRAVPTVQVEEPAVKQTVYPVAEQVASTLPVAEEPKPEPTPETSASQEGLHKICSPMVGTFYKAPSPDADPYVQVGDKVNETSVVCIVEAMKLMNEIEAEIRGEIVETLVENGQLVEYGQPLFLVKPE